MENIGQMTTHAKAAESGSFDKIFNAVFADHWINLTDGALYFIFQFKSCCSV